MESISTPGNRARTTTTTAALAALLGLIVLPAAGCAVEVSEGGEAGSAAAAGETTPAQSAAVAEAPAPDARPAAGAPAAEAPVAGTPVAGTPVAGTPVAQASDAQDVAVKEISLGGQTLHLTNEQVSVASGSLDGGTVAMSSQPAAPAAREESTASGSAHRPPTLDTGFDLSKLQVPVTNPTRSPTFAEAAGAADTDHDHATHDQGEEPAPQHTGPAGKIVWGPGGNEHDFGDLIQGAVRAHTFEFTNEGEGELVIDKIKPSCGCTVAQTMIVAEDGSKTPYVIGQPLPVGARVEVTPRVNTRGKSGRLHSNVNIFCNDERGVVTISLMGTVKPYFTMEPQHLNFNRVHAGDTAEGTIKITSAIAERFKLEVDESILPPEMTVELTPVEPDEAGSASEWQLHVVLETGDSEGMKSHPVKLVSDQPTQIDTEGVENPAVATAGLPAHQETMVYVMATVTGAIEVMPRYMSFSMMRPGQSVTKSVMLEAFDEGFELPEPVLSVLGYRGEFEHPDCVTLSAERSADGKAWQVSLTVHDLPEDLNGSFRGKVVIETGHEKKPRIEVPFSGVCRPGVEQAQVPAPTQSGAGGR